MKEYSFYNCKKIAHGDASYLAVGDCQSYRFSERLETVLRKLQDSYARAFPKAPPLRIGLVIEERNGASARWSVAGPSSSGPTFIVEVDPSLEHDEVTLAHEFVHPTVRLLGVPTGHSVGQIDHRIGDEFTSTSHHPYVFQTLADAGYDDEQRAAYATNAEQEIAKLRTVKWSDPTYLNPPGQTWLALWYFNFYLLARPQYDAILGLHSRHAAGVAKRMAAVESAWRAATRNRQVLKPSAGVHPIVSFQAELYTRLDLKGRVALQSFNDWATWLFHGI